MAPTRDVQLLMPRLGEPLEPERVERVDALWRPIAALERRAAGRLQREQLHQIQTKAGQ